MAIYRGYTPEEQIGLVLEYLALPHGTKAQWLEEHNLNARSISQLKRAYFAGDLERHLVPRTMEGMKDKPPARLLTLESENKALKKRLATLEKKLDQADQVNEVLGKAIGLVERFCDADEPTEAKPTTTTSSQKKTGSSKSSSQSFHKTLP